MILAMLPINVEIAKPRNIAFAIQKTSAPTAQSAMTPRPAITSSEC